MAAQLALAQLHLERGAAGDRDRALRWLREAAQAGDVSAALALALVLQRNSVAAEAAEAIGWLTRASDQGSVDATFQLALAYYRGVGVAQNFERAADYFEQAARRGSISSQYNLGAMIRDGRGRSKSPSEALAWIEFAISGAAPGAQRAEFERAAALLREDMTSEDIVRAEARRAQLEREVRARRSSQGALAPRPPRRSGRLQLGVRSESDWLSRNLVEHGREPLRTSTYVEATGQAVASAPWVDGLQLRASGSVYVSHPVSGRTDRDLQYAAVNVAPHVPLWSSGAVSVQPFLGADLTSLNWTRFASSYGVGINFTRILDRETTAAITLAATQRDYQGGAKYLRNPELSGLRTSASARLVRRVTPAATGVISLGYLHTEAARAWRSHDQADAATSLTLRLRNPLLAGGAPPLRASASASLAWRDFDLPDPLLGAAFDRRDRDLALRASLEAPLSGRVSVGASASRFERASNVRIYDYRALEGAVWISLAY